MAAYAHTTTLTRTHTQKISPGRMGFLFGKTDVSNSSPTHIQITKITDQFSASTQVDVIVSGVSDNGYLVRWDRTTMAFEIRHLGSTAATLFAEAAEDVDAGEFDWIAVGLI